jgi:hypothetical protein
MVIDPNFPIAGLTVGQLLQVIRDAVAPAPADTLISQRESPLGPKRHARAVRERLERGEPGASVVGRRFLLTSSALAEELTRLGRAETAAEPDAAERLRAELARGAA